LVARFEIQGVYKILSGKSREEYKGVQRRRARNGLRSQSAR
jgi:hypothetical protein